MNVLVFAAHPDDEVLGCGGTIARLADEGHQVRICIVGEGATSRYTSRDQSIPDEVEELEGVATNVGHFLGAVSVDLFGLPDNRFDSVDLLDLVKVVEGEIAKWDPEIVFTQHGGDLNIDHVCLFRAVLTATRPVGDNRIRAVYAYEVGSSSEWSFQMFSPAFRPDYFVDIEGYVDRKVEAMGMYESEARPFPHPRSPEAIRAKAATWGSTAGMHAVEAFQTVRRLALKGSTI